MTLNQNPDAEQRARDVRRRLERYKAIADAVRQPNRGTPAERASLEAEVMADLSGLRAQANREALGTAAD
jgi:hypothetical protein